MRNFNTNQTRHFYPAGIGTATAELGFYPSAVGSIVEGLYFKGKNADGLDYRSDTIDPKKIVSLKKTASADLAVPCLQHTVIIDTATFANVAALAGKTVKLAVTVHQLFDYDDSNCVTFAVEHTVAASETAANFYKALADAITLNMPKPDKNYPLFTVTSSASGLVLTEGLQKYVRGKLTGEPAKLSVAFDVDDEFVAWGKDTVTESATAKLPANYILADLEYFAYGERGDYYRGYNFPNDFTPTYVIDPKSTEAYDVLTIEYYYAGNAENIQKSPRVIQVAGAEATISALYTKIKDFMDGKAVPSGD